MMVVQIIKYSHMNNLKHKVNQTECFSYYTFVFAATTAALVYIIYS